jgi:hypothetical protein
VRICISCEVPSIADTTLGISGIPFLLPPDWGGWPLNFTIKRKGMPDIPSVVSAIDGTSHEIQIPFNEPQQQFDSGHGKYYCIHTQVKKYNSENE